MYNLQKTVKFNETIFTTKYSTHIVEKKTLSYTANLFLKTNIMLLSFPKQ